MKFWIFHSSFKLDFLIKLTKIIVRVHFWIIEIHRVICGSKDDRQKMMKFILDR